MYKGGRIKCCQSWISSQDLEQIEKVINDKKRQNIIEMVQK